MAEESGRNGVRATVGVAARAVGLLLGIPIVVGAATGWLYWLRNHVAGWPGPRVSEALPLDELPRHDSIPLVVYVAVFAVAAGLLGLLTRAARLDRVAAALALAAGVGFWTYAIDAFSLYVVRQVPANAALHAAVGLQPVYLAPLLAGAAGAVLARSAPTGIRWNRILAWAVATCGLLDIASGILPHRRMTAEVFAVIAPRSTSSLAAGLIVPAGLLLLVTSRGLSRQSRPAWLVAISVLGASAILHLLKGPEFGSALLAALVLLAMLARRQDFTLAADPVARSGALLRFGGMLVAAIVFGFVALVVNQALADLPFNPGGAFVDTLRVVIGHASLGTKYLLGDVPVWFSWWVRVIAIMGLGWAAATWLAPWRERFSEDTLRRQRALAIVRDFGGDTLAPFALRRDKALFLYEPPEQSAAQAAGVVIAYRVVRGIAIASDPIGPTEYLGDACDAFVVYAHLHGWRVAVLGVSEDMLGLYRSRGLRALYHGDEAVIDTKSFSLEGGRMRAVRQAVHRLERRGFVAEVISAGLVPSDLAVVMRSVEEGWLKGRAKTGFTMELDDLFQLKGDDAFFVIGRYSDGRVAGLLHMAVCRPSRSLSLSSMPHRDDVPNGFNSWLIVEAVRWANENNFDHLSLNFSPFARLLVDQAERSVAQRLERDALLALKGALSLQLDNLLTFNRQFCPRSQARYVVYEHRADLPRIAIAAMAAEGYLPFSEATRGSEWEGAAGGGAAEGIDAKGDDVAPPVVLATSRRDVSRTDQA